MIEEDHDLSVSKQCKLLGLSRSSYYYECKGESPENLEIMREIDKIYLEFAFYGYRKVVVELEKLGYKVNKKRVKRLMKLVGWRTLYPAPKTSISDPKSYKYPYLLGGLKVERVNQVWAMDITYIPMKHGFMYLAAIIDLKSRYVVAWSISNTMTAKWCAELVEEAVKNFGMPEIFNTDQGVQFTSEIFIQTLKKHQIQISMDGKGRALDNIFIERLWRSVKYENVYLKVYETSRELIKGMNEYFDFYNNRRFHQSLDYLVPAQIFKQTA